MMIVSKGLGNIEWPKNVGKNHYCSIFSTWVYFHEHSRFTGQKSNGVGGGAISLTLHGGKRFWTNNL